MHGCAHGLFKPRPINFVAAILRWHDVRFKVDASQIAGLVGQQRLLTAGVRRLDHRVMRGGVRAVRLVNEEQTRFAVSPGRLRNLLQDLPGIELPDNLARPRIDQVIFFAGQSGFHESIGHRHADIEVRDFLRIGLATNEV